MKKAKISFEIIKRINIETDLNLEDFQKNINMNSQKYKDMKESLDEPTQGNAFQDYEIEFIQKYLPEGFDYNPESFEIEKYQY